MSGYTPAFQMSLLPLLDLRTYYDIAIYRRLNKWTLGIKIMHNIYVRSLWNENCTVLLGDWYVFPYTVIGIYEDDGSARSAGPGLPSSHQNFHCSRVLTKLRSSHSMQWSQEQSFLLGDPSPKPQRGLIGRAYPSFGTNLKKMSFRVMEMGLQREPRAQAYHHPHPSKGPRTQCSFTLALASAEGLDVPSSETNGCIFWCAEIERGLKWKWKFLSASE